MRLSMGKGRCWCWLRRPRLMSRSAMISCAWRPSPVPKWIWSKGMRHFNRWAALAHCCAIVPCGCKREQVKLTSRVTQKAPWLCCLCRCTSGGCEGAFYALPTPASGGALGYEPTSMEIGKELGMSAEQVDEAVSSSQKPASLEALASEEEKMSFEVGEALGVSRERIRQIELMALRKLHDASSIRKLRDYL